MLYPLHFKIGVQHNQLNFCNSLLRFELRLDYTSTVQDVSQVLEKASKILQRTIKIVDVKGGEQVFKFKQAQKFQIFEKKLSLSVRSPCAEPYHLCFVDDSNSQESTVYFRCWLSITCKNVRNTLASDQ